MLGSDLKHLKFFQFWVPLQVKRLLSVKLCQNTWGAGADWKDQVSLPVNSAGGLSCIAALGGQSPAAGKRHQVGCGGLVQVGWVNTLTASRQMAQFLYFQWKIFQLQFFFLFVNIFLRSLFIFWIKGNHPWHNTGWILPWKSLFPLNAPCSFSRHFPTKGSGISAFPACAPDEFYLGWFMFLPVSACYFFFFFIASLIQYPLKRMNIFLVTPSRLTELYS